MSIKPYFWPKTTHDVKSDKLVVPAELDEPEAPLFTKKVPQKPTEPAEPTIKCGWECPQKHFVTKSTVTENYLTFAGISVKQSPPADISVLVQETPFTDLWCKEINRLLEKGVFTVITERDVLQGIYIFNLCFIDKIKHPGTDRAFEKSRLVVQAYND